MPGNSTLSVSTGLSSSLSSLQTESVSVCDNDNESESQRYKIELERMKKELENAKKLLHEKTEECNRMLAESEEFGRVKHREIFKLKCDLEQARTERSKERQKSHWKLQKVMESIKCINDELVALIETLQKQENQAEEQMRVNTNNDDDTRFPDGLEAEEIRQYLKQKFDHLSELMKQRTKSMKSNETRMNNLIRQVAQTFSSKAGSGVGSASSANSQSSHLLSGEETINCPATTSRTMDLRTSDSFPSTPPSETINGTFNSQSGEPAFTSQGNQSSTFLECQGSASQTNQASTSQANHVGQSTSLEIHASTPQGTNASTSQEIQVSQCTNASTSQEIQVSTSQGTNASTSQEIQASTSQKIQASTSQEIQASTSQEIQASTSQKIQASTSQEIQASTSQGTQATTSQEMENDDDVIDVLNVEPDSNEQQSPTPPSELQGAGESVPTVSLSQIKSEPGDPFQLFPERKHRFNVRTRGNNKYYCTCGIGFKSRKKLNLHIDFWSKAYKNTIRISEYCFSKIPPKRSRRSQKKLSAVDKKFPCDMCEQRFLGVSLLKTHKAKAHHVVANPRFEIGCRECGSIFQSRAEFCQHRMPVNKTCHWKTPTTDGIQVVHQLVQNDVDTSIISNNLSRQLQPVPSTSASSSSRFQQENQVSVGRGIKQHSVDKSKPAILGHFCTCGSKFLTFASLTAHIQAQTVKRKKTCKRCGANFSSDIGLQQHMARIHNVGKNQNKKQIAPFRCSCGKGYYHKQMLEKHFRSHEYRRIFKCITCRKVFNDEKRLRLHTKKFHS